jgi:hypothetical protein
LVVLRQKVTTLGAILVLQGREYVLVVGRLSVATVMAPKVRNDMIFETNMEAAK